MWLYVDGSPVHVHTRGILTAGEEDALIEVIRAARKEIKPAEYEQGATELRRRLDRLDLSLREAVRKWPQWGVGQWSRMLNGKDDPTPALEVVPA